MEGTVTLEMTPTTDAEYEAVIDQYIGQMKLMQKQMDEDRHEIETLRSGTDAILADIFQTLMPANTVRRSVVDVLADAGTSGVSRRGHRRCVYSQRTQRLE